MGHGIYTEVRPNFGFWQRESVGIERSKTTFTQSFFERMWDTNAFVSCNLHLFHERATLSPTRDGPVFSP